MSFPQVLGMFTKLVSAAMDRSPVRAVPKQTLPGI